VVKPSADSDRSAARCQNHLGWVPVGQVAQAKLTHTIVPPAAKYSLVGDGTGMVIAYIYLHHRSCVRKCTEKRLRGNLWCGLVTPAEDISGVQDAAGTRIARDYGKKLRVGRDVNDL